MTEKMKIFVDEYLKDLNGTRAYKVAYPNIKSDNAAAVGATRLLRNDKIKKYIDDCLDKLHDERTADAKEVIEYLTSVMRGKQKEQTMRLIGDGVQQITDIAVSAKERLKAAELLGKRYGLFKDQVELSGSVDTGVKQLDNIIEQLNGGDG